MMKTKKKTVAIVMIVLLVALVGVTVWIAVLKPQRDRIASPSWNEWINESYLGWSKSNKRMKAFAEQHNVDDDRLTPYSYEEFHYYFGIRNYVLADSSHDLKTLRSFNRMFPIERIKPIDEDNLCVVYKLESEDLYSTLAYVLFQREVHFYTKKDGVNKMGYYESWCKTGELYFANEILTQEAYADVKIGDSLFSVADIDNAVIFDEMGGYYVSATQIHTIPSYRLLQDGMLIIKFEAPADQVTHLFPPLSEYTVTEKTFYPFDGDVIPKYVSLSLLPALVE